MTRVLVPFSDRASGQRAVARLLSQRRRARLLVELLAIVDPLTPGKVRIFVTPERARAQSRAAAESWLRDLEARLDAAGIPHRSSIAFGKLRDIRKRARARTDIDEVVLGAAEHDALRGLRRRLVAQAMARPLVTIS
jgi:nucleotide-binding universal stress UspA family protein